MSAPDPLAPFPGDAGPVLALDIGGTKLAAAVITPDGAASGLVTAPTPHTGDWRAATGRLFALGREALRRAAPELAGEAGEGWAVREPGGRKTAGDPGGSASWAVREPGGRKTAGDPGVGAGWVVREPDPGVGAGRAVRGAGLGGIRAVGLACGGPLDAASGTVMSPPHLPGWTRVPIGPLAAEAFGVPFALENDATAAAVAEYRFGAGRGTGTMLYLTVSTGIGGGAIVGGRLHRGAAGNGGEFGHIIVRRGGRLCACGRRGCVEAYASGSAIAQRAAEACGRAMTAADVTAAVAAGDPAAAAVWAETADLLGAAVADLVNVFEPDLVVLGGGVTRCGDMLLGPVREVVAREAMPPAARAARVEPAALGDRVGVIGAGVVALALPLEDSPATGTTGSERAMAHWMESHLDEHVAVASALGALTAEIRAAGELVCRRLAGGGTVYTLGNGGSAADAQHLTGELVGHFKRHRRPLPAVTLSADPSVLTCVANDYAYADVFARQIEALARPQDVVVAFTTSGRSPNVTSALAAGRARGALTLLFAGGDGGPATVHADRVLLVPSKSSQRIQEMHTLMLHMISEMVDAWAAGEEPAP
ncbi:ROK family protein [Paractinoplanes atraurantiacus]|uniref:Sugar kinase of the NBD/HSP70 family, may contain an N-terminal HTH domain n=1 Tax=Paractinoplanes atraurantiacus TaxID=1036182 RepID=A0A285J532_9ACTN|nr:ROK family protein [Actinoplanes atraurantiacus]SNY55322.1 Sugar kinase of the NBD/HSP70 family, may contain an N-terminal HTH domain [Actinoplanes atraurantiacus]